jgi:hypothetical protein
MMFLLHPHIKTFQQLIATMTTTIELLAQERHRETQTRAKPSNTLPSLNLSFHKKRCDSWPEKPGNFLRLAWEMLDETHNA